MTERQVVRENNSTIIELTSEGEAEFLARQPTAEEIQEKKIKLITVAVQQHLDAIAQSWGYDSIVSLCTYEGNSHPKYSAEGAAGKSWRSSVWSYCEIELAKITNGERPEPESSAAFILELPVITRPIV